MREIKFRAWDKVREKWVDVITVENVKELINQRVEWLKERMIKYPIEAEDNDQGIMLNDFLNLIDKAFEDVVNDE